MGIFTFLKIVQMAPGHAKHHIYIHVDASPLFTFDPMEGVAQWGLKLHPGPQFELKY